MQIRTRIVKKNILKVVCSEYTENLEYAVSGKHGHQILSWASEARAEGGKIQTELRESEMTFTGEDGSVLLSQLSAVLYPVEVFRYTFTGTTPIIVTKKTIDGERSFIENADSVKVADAYQGILKFAITPDEGIYGLGQQENGKYNYRNVKEYLYQNNMKIPMPVFLSSQGYSLVFDADCMMTYEEKDNVVTVTFDAVEEICYYLIQGDRFDDLISGIRYLTGQAVLLPEWAFGYVQSKERYKTQEEILAVAKEFEKRKIPVSCLVLDWMSWEDGKWGNKVFDKSRFADAKSMVDILHEKGIAFMISVWPNMNQGTDNNEEMKKAGKLLCNYSTYDAFDTEARALYWKQCERELFAAGADAWWCDSTEPFTPDWGGEEKKPDEERYQLARDSTNRFLDARIANTFALAHAKGMYENQRAVCNSKRVVNLTRSGSLGSQRYGTILWSGDIAATWEVFRHQLAEGLSICMSGIPYWTLDAGAFFTGTLDCWRRFTGQPTAKGPQPWFWHGLFEKGVEDLGYRELYVRWIQMAAFLPMMRSHGTDTPREPWNFGEPGTVYYDTIVRYIRKRYRMLPYSYSLGNKVLREGYTILRSLMFDFAEDVNVRNMWEQYMYGPAYLVCPVTRPLEYGPDNTPLQEEQVQVVYLPSGADWYEEETDIWYAGGQSVCVKAPVGQMPLFVKAGSIIPMSSEGNQKADEIHVYTGENGKFSLYLDNGIDYGYEQGEYTVIDLCWNEEQQKLYADVVREGYNYPKNFRVILHRYRERNEWNKLHSKNAADINCNRILNMGECNGDKI